MYATIFNENSDPSVPLKKIDKLVVKDNAELTKEVDPSFVRTVFVVIPPVTITIPLECKATET